MSTQSPNMGLVIPTVGVELSPTWAVDLNADLSILDGHTHASGQGVAITPPGININSDLTFNSLNAIALRSARFTAQVSPISNAGTDVGCLYVSGNEIYYNDVSGGHQVQLTTNGSVNSGAGSISGLPSGTASASFSAGTFVWQSATSTPANMDGASYVLRNNSANSKGLTLEPPASMGADFSLTLPALPGSTSLMALDSSGNMSAPYSISGGLNANVLTAGSITTTQLASQAVAASNIVNNSITSAQISSSANITNRQLIAVNFAVSSAITFNVVSGSMAAVTGLTVSVTGVNNRPIKVELQAPNSIFGASISINSVTFEIGCQNSAVSASVVHVWSGSSNAVQAFSPNIYSFVDTSPAVGVNTYQIYARIISGSLFQINNVQIIAYEL